jgi:hypothetical protein
MNTDKWDSSGFKNLILDVNLRINNHRNDHLHLQQVQVQVVKGTVFFKQSLKSESRTNPPL